MERHLIIINELGESVDLYTDEGIRLVSIDGIGFEANIKSMEVHGYDGTLYQDEQLKLRNIPIIVRYRGPTWKHEQHKNRLSRLIANKQMLTIRKVTDNIDVYIKGYTERVNTPPNIHPMTTQISITCTDPYWRKSGDNTVLMAGTRKCWKFPISIAAVRPQTAMFLSDGGNIGNAVEYPLVGLNLYGKSTQGYANYGGTPLGKNILMQTCVDETQYGITFTKQPDGSIIMNGTSTANFSYVIYDYNKSNALVLDGGKYTISFGDEFDVWAKSSSATASMVVGYQVGESKKYPCYRKEGTYTFSTDEYVEERNLFVRVTLDAGAVCENVRIYPQIEKGDTATEYEPYMCNPNPDCPIPIESVGDDVAINVTSCGKNLLNIRDDLPITVSGVTISRDNTGNIILNGTATATISVSLSTIDLPYNTYTMSIDSKIEGIGISCTDFGSIFLASTKNSVTIENSGSGNLRLNISPNIVLENFVLNPQIELGTTATEYEPYTGNTAIITSGLPLCSVGNYRDELIYSGNGTGKIVKHIYKTVLNGSEDWKSGSTNTTGKQRIYLTIADETLKALYGSKYNSDTLSMIKCNQYISVTNNGTYRCTQGISVNHIYGNAIAVYDENFATATLDEWKAHLAANPLTVIYVLNTPQEIELSAVEMVALRALQTFEGNNNLFNDEAAEMLIKYKGVIL